MIQIIKKTNIDFVGKFKIVGTITFLLSVVGLYVAFTQMNYGVDFRGGAEVQVKFEKTVSLEAVRTVLDKEKFSGVVVQTIGDVQDNELLIKVSGDESNLNDVTEKLSSVMTSQFKDSGVDMRKVDIVGPKAGANLRMSAFLAIGWALLAIMVYIGIRFDYRYAPGAFLCLFHDVSLILGIFALTGLDFTLQIVAAILAIIGYSINDTVIVYDRIREHEENIAGLTFKEHVNRAINETLQRTVMTSLATFIVCIIMVFMGGIVIRDFFIVMSMGIVIGTYSSIFVASGSTYLMEYWRLKKENK